MSDTQSAHGHCLCGKIEITAAHLNRHVHACHCGMCRRWSGGPMLSVDCGNDVTFSGQENIGVYASSDWAERGFCKICGTSLFYRLVADQHYYVPIGLFDDATRITLQGQLFIDKKPDYYSFAEQTTNMTEAEVFALFAAAEDQSG